VTEAYICPIVAMNASCILTLHDFRN